MVIDIINKAGSQEMAVALNQGLTQAIEKIWEESPELDEEKQVTRESEVKQLLKNQSAKEVGMNLLKDFLAKAAGIGLTFNQRINPKDNVKDEYDRLFNRLESFEDKVEIKSNLPTYILQAKKLNLKGGGGGGPEGELTPSIKTELKEALRDYAKVYSQYLLSHDPKLKRKLEELERVLLEKGLSARDLLELQLSLKKSVRGEIAQQIKEQFLKRTLGQSQLETIMHERGVNDLLELAYFSDKLGRWDFGNYHGSLQGTTDEMHRQALEELKSLVPDELETLMVRKILTGNKDSKDIEIYLKLAQRTGFDVENWIKNIMPERKHDLGLNFIDVPPSVTGQVIDAHTDDPSQNRKHGYEYEEKDKGEILVNRLRGLYMQRIIKGDIRTHLTTSFKIVTLKNGLRKLGIFTAELDEQVKKEAEIAAKVKVLEVLNEALLERATLYELAGPAHELIERKIKGVLKNAERLDMAISTLEFNSLRDAANRRMYEISKRELEVVEKSIEHKLSPELDKKQKLLVKLLKRLAE